MSIILVANTPHSAALIIPAIAELHPDAGPVITIAASRTEFSFPEKTAYSEFPVIRTVEREPFLIDYGFAPRRKTTPISINEVIEELGQASKVYLFNPGPDGFRSHYHATLMTRCYSKDAEIRVIEDHVLQSTSVTKEAIETAALIEDYKPILDAVAIAEHFDFNYRVNSHPLITNLFEHAGSKAWRNLSAGALQLLLWLRSRGKGKGRNSFSSKELAIKAKLWEGSGKFACVDSFGRRISLQAGDHYYDPVGELSGMRLLEGEQERLRLSSTGEFVADAFPSSCRDPDLPFRIEAWKRLPVAEAISEIDTYLINFFAFHKSVAGGRAAGDFFCGRGA
jgi:hypothetical protein